MQSLFLCKIISFDGGWMAVVGAICLVLIVFNDVLMEQYEVSSKLLVFDLF